MECHGTSAARKRLFLHMAFHWLRKRGDGSRHWRRDFGGRQLRFLSRTRDSSSRSAASPGRASHRIGKRSTRSGAEEDEGEDEDEDKEQSPSSFASSSSPACVILYRHPSASRPSGTLVCKVRVLCLGSLLPEVGGSGLAETSRSATGVGWRCLGSRCSRVCSP